MQHIGNRLDYPVFAATVACEAGIGRERSIDLPNNIIPCNASLCLEPQRSVKDIALLNTCPMATKPACRPSGLNVVPLHSAAHHTFREPTPVGLVNPVVVRGPPLSPITHNSVICGTHDLPVIRSFPESEDFDKVAICSAGKGIRHVRPHQPEQRGASRPGQFVGIHQESCFEDAHADVGVKVPYFIRSGQDDEFLQRSSLYRAGTVFVGYRKEIK